jgi:hypothetical protein
MVQIICSGTLWAQKVGELGYQYPVLNEDDFKIFLKQFDNPDIERDTFLNENNITEEQYEAMVFKITMNLAADLLGKSDVLAEEFGSSIVFNKDETDIFARYQDRILTAVEDNVMDMKERLGVN